MKKILLTAALVASLSGGTVQTVCAQEYDASASTSLFDFNPFNDSNLLTLFYNALQDGRNYPTMEEFEAAGFTAMDIEFARSHVRKREIINDQSNQLLSGVSNTRRLWLNVPMGTGKTTGGYPGTNTGDDTYTMWNYTHLFGSWNHGLFQAPGCWIDAAHRNGTDIMSGIKFFESWTAGSGDKAYSKLISEKNADGTYKYVKPVINCLLYFGADGINYNWEDASYSNTDIIRFHQALYKEAERVGFDNFHIGLYTSVSTLTAGNAESLFGSKTNGKTADTFLNYAAGDFTYGIAASENTAKNTLGTVDGLYAGVWIVHMNRRWTSLAGNSIGAVLWGEHANSRFWSWNVGDDANSFQSNYQALLERGFSGGYRNPARRPTMQNSGNDWSWNGTTPPLSTFGGLATYFPERSAITSMPFRTYFNIGVGDRYNYKGKKTAGPWYNLSTQDIVPTYRWLVRSANTTTVATNIQPEFTIDDSYQGGSSLRLTGTPSASGTDIVLYRTELPVASAGTYAKVAIKSGIEGDNASNLYLILKKKGETTYHEYPVGNTTSKNWEEKNIALDLASGDVVQFVGLRVKGSTSGSYNMYVGKLEINDEKTVVPAEIKDFTVEVKRETTKSLAVKLNWALDATGNTRSDWGMVFNEDGNVDHFEVLYKNGEDGRISAISHVQGWSDYIGDIPMADGEDPYIGVRAVSTDLKTYSDPVWVHVSRSSNVPTGVEGDVVYGISEINPSSEGYQTAFDTRYITSVTSTGASVANINFTGSKQQDGTNYVDGTSSVLKVKQGDKVTINWVYNSASDGLQYCTMKTYADWNINGYFESKTDELIVEQGGEKQNNSSNLKPFTLNVPEDAVCGFTRMRMVFSDAWFPHPGPTCLTTKGYTLDLAIEVSGANAERTPPADTHDQGVSDIPDGLDGDLTAINTLTGAVSSAVVANDCINLENVEKVWIYSADGKLVNFTKDSPTSISTKEFPPGTYIVKMQSGNVIRAVKIAI